MHEGNHTFTQIMPRKTESLHALYDVCANYDMSPPGETEQASCQSFSEEALQIAEAPASPAELAVRQCHAQLTDISTDC